MILTGEAKARAFEFAGERIINLEKRLHQVANFSFRDADAAIRYGNNQPTVGGNGDLDRYGAFVRGLHRVGQQIEPWLICRPGVRIKGRRSGILQD